MTIFSKGKGIQMLSISATLLLIAVLLVPAQKVYAGGNSESGNSLLEYTKYLIDRGTKKDDFPSMTFHWVKSHAKELGFQNDQGEVDMAGIRFCTRSLVGFVAENQLAVTAFASEAQLDHYRNRAMRSLNFFANDSKANCGNREFWKSQIEEFGAEYFPNAKNT